MISFDQIKQGAVVIADTAAKTGADLYHKGKKHVNLMALDAKLAKAQRQLGALVYSLRKNAEENEELVGRYIETIAAIEREITACNVSGACPVPNAECTNTILCPGCGAEVDPNAIFCSGCGGKL